VTWLCIPIRPPPGKITTDYKTAAAGGKSNQPIAQTCFNNALLTKGRGIASGSGVASALTLQGGDRNDGGCGICRPGSTDSLKSMHGLKTADWPSVNHDVHFLQQAWLSLSGVQG